jgi:predicted nucleotidyltransferase
MLLREKDKQTLLHIFASADIPIEVWAYGSRVNGAAHEGSDLDLVIRSADLKPIPFDIYTELNEKIKDSNIPILVELRDWAVLPESFHKSIKQQYELFFSSLHAILKDPPAKYKSGNNKGEPDTSA